MIPDTKPFTVLMPLWAGDDPEWFVAAFTSATEAQELQPAEVVIAIDGQIGEDLRSAISEVQHIPGPWTVKIAHSKKHVGLAENLQQALKACSHEIIARADADDLNYPLRFARQIPYLIEHDLDLLGCAMRELPAEELTIATRAGSHYLESAAAEVVRSRPETQGEIMDYVGGHNPFQHPTVVFKKSAVATAGGYRDLPLLEDYWLWVRMLLSGAKVANLPDVLVDYRVTENLYRRRGGLELWRSDLKLQLIMLRCGLIGWPRMAKNLCLRAAYRIVPPQIRRFAYQRLVNRS